jgi:UDP-N-acetylglucosamine 1-carboxyvinyltransferase
MKNEFFIPDSINIDARKIAPSETIYISGAKNEVLGAMAAAVLTDKPFVLDNVPNISDVLDMGRILLELGADVGYDARRRRMRIHAKKIKTNILSDAAYKFRASYYLWGALLARFVITGEFDSLRVRLPGGCALGGSRGIDFHVDLLQNVFSAEYSDDNEYLEFKLPTDQKTKRPTDQPIYSTRLVSHGATFHWLLSVAATLGTHVIYNASMEPEVPHLLWILNQMGANIRGTNSTAIISSGRGKLLNGGEFAVMPDRLETGSYAIMAYALRRKLTLKLTDPASCRPWLNSLTELAGADTINISGDTMNFDFTDAPRFTGAKTYVMSPIPGKETDLQQVWTPALAVRAAPRASATILDPVWPNRTAHLAEMEKFGLNSSHRKIEIKNSVAAAAAEIVVRPSKFAPATARGMDLRGTFGLIVCAAVSGGVSEIENPAPVLRGYPNLIANLEKFGLKIQASKSGETVPPLPELKK